MKLRGKLVLSYIVLVLIVFAVFYIVSMPLIRNYIRKDVADGLVQERILIKSRLTEALDDVTDRETYLRALAGERIAIERLGLGSSMAVLRYSNQADRVDFVQEISPDTGTLDEIRKRISERDSSPFTGTIESQPHTMLVFPIPTEVALQRFFLLLYTPDTSLVSFTRGFTRIIIWVFGATITIAVLLSLVLAEKMTNPIEKLKKQAHMIRKRNFTAKSAISTKDEFMELSVALNQASSELESYDAAQKEFLDNVSHELKTPLMSIQGYAEGIRDGIFEPEQKILDIIIGESTRLKNLVGGISYLSKLESSLDFYDFVHVNIGDILRNALETLSGLEDARKKKLILLDVPDAMITGDSGKLTQLLVNILSNGLRYAENSVMVEASVYNKYYIIRIMDDGPGFPEENAEKLFRRFFKGEGGNTGIGLAISIAIAQKHGGTISAGNISPHGAIFTVQLPITEK